MQIDAIEFLQMAKEAGKVAVWDTEALGMNFDYASIICLSVKVWGGETRTFAISQPGNDQRVAREAAEYLDQFAVWITYYGKGYDVPGLQTRMLKWGLGRLNKKHHWDVYFTIKHKLKTGRRSQAHLAEWLDLDKKKISVSPDEWNAVVRRENGAVKRLVERCEGDCDTLDQLANETVCLVDNLSR